MAEVALEHLGKTYAGSVAALRDLNLHIDDGELIALVGPSGSGKTTFLRLIAGLETPTTGNIRIDGRLVNDWPPHRRDVAMVFQRPALYPHLSVRANLAFSLTMRQRGRWFGLGRNRRDESADERIDRIAVQLGLEKVLDRWPGTLSGGQQQRVALGRALVRRPAVFLLDEPLSNLDARLRLEMRRELHLLHRRIRATMILVTHDQDEAMTLGERVVVLDQGVVRQIDRPADLLDRPANRFVAGFLGWPPMNFLDGELSAVEDRMIFGNWDVCLVAALRPDWRPFLGRRLTLGIRPEDVSLSQGPGEGRLSMKVGLVERPGIVHLTNASWTVTARLGATPAMSEGDSVIAAFDLTRAHLFDPATGRALCHGLGERGV
jgi:multiple sugar transport system ATP-binding protein